MKTKALLNILVALSISGCGVLSDSGPSTSGHYVISGTAGALAGAGIGAAIANSLKNGDVTNSALLGAGVGLTVAVAGTYAYKKIRDHNELIDNDNLIESNRRQILAKQQDLDALRSEAIADSRAIDLEDLERNEDDVYEGPSLGVYYR